MVHKNNTPLHAISSSSHLNHQDHRQKIREVTLSTITLTMSGLFHLVEAATVLTQLGPSNLRPSTAYQAASTSTTSRQVNRHIASISDDDETLANACSTMARLRENHLQALCAAAADASLASTTISSAKSNSVEATSITLESVSSPHPTLSSQRDSGESSLASKEMFPMRLHALLADPTVRDIITWLPHGRSFVVLRPDVFATHVLPRYFAPEGSNSPNARVSSVIPTDGNLVSMIPQSKGVHKYPSFTRKLNRWGFRQISRGPDSGAFCHDLFQRDVPELCRGMVCQKSRKSKNFERISDDIMSVSSGSTMETVNKSIASIEKRRFSSIVTVSTAGVTSIKSSLPLKKRKSGQHSSKTTDYMMNGIPSMISHRFQKMSSSSSITESDLTSENGSVGSNNNTNIDNQKSASERNPPTGGAQNSAQIAESLARESLAHHFHEQRRAFALASLLENSRLAMEAAGMNPDHSVTDAISQTHAPVQPSWRATYYTSQTEGGVGEQSNPPLVGSTTIQPTIGCDPVSTKMKMACIPEVPSTSISMVDVAKMALYKAYLEALTGSSP